MDFIDFGSSDGMNFELFVDWSISFSMGGSCFVLLFDITFDKFFVIFSSLGGSFSAIVFSDLNFLVFILNEDDWVELPWSMKQTVFLLAY